MWVAPVAGLRVYHVEPGQASRAMTYSPWSTTPCGRNDMLVYTARLLGTSPLCSASPPSLRMSGPLSEKTELGGRERRSA